MTDQEILEKAIHKAIDGGWKVPVIMVKNDWRSKASYGYYDIIFNHDFAKALWGEEFIDTGLLYQREVGGKQVIYQQKLWQYHLQQMVIAEDPIKYLGDNVQ